MSWLYEIHQRPQKRSLRFLLIGGCAVNAHGLARVTDDPDLRSKKFRGLFAKKYDNLRLESLTDG